MYSVGKVPNTSFAPHVTQANLPPTSPDICPLKIASVSNTASWMTWPAGPVSRPDKRCSSILGIPGEALENRTALAAYLKTQNHGLHPQIAAKIVGLKVSNVEAIPEFLKISKFGQAAAATVPRGNGEAPLSYVRRLKKKFPDLSARDAAAAARIRVENVKVLHEFNVLSAEVQSYLKSLPRGHREAGTAYARRLKLRFPGLSVKDASAAAEVRTSNIRALPEFHNRNASYASELNQGTPGLSSRYVGNISSQTKPDAVSGQGTGQASLPVISPPGSDDDMPLDLRTKKLI